MTLEELLRTIDDCWREWREQIARLPLEAYDRQTGAGWTVKEMLGHIAFWEETVEPVVVGMFRGQLIADADWYGGGSLDLGADWPKTDVHNAREAAWAASQPPSAVLRRLDSAHASVVSMVRGLSQAELAERRYVTKIWDATCDHYARHLEEVRGQR